MTSSSSSALRFAWSRRNTVFGTTCTFCFEEGTFLFRNGCPVEEIDLSCARAAKASAFHENAVVEADCCWLVSQSCLALKDAKNESSFSFYSPESGWWNFHAYWVLLEHIFELRPSVNLNCPPCQNESLHEEEEYYGMYEDASAQALPDLRYIQWELVLRTHLGTRFYCIVGKHFVDSV